MSVPKHDQLETVDNLLASISKLEDELKHTSTELSDLVDSNESESKKIYKEMVDKIKASKDLEVQNADLNKLRIQEESIKQEIYTKVLLQVDKLVDNGLYADFIKGFFADFAEEGTITADPNLHKNIPSKFKPKKGETGQFLISTKTKEYDLGINTIKQELANKFTIQVLNQFSDKIK